MNTEKPQTESMPAQVSVPVPSHIREPNIAIVFDRLARDPGVPVERIERILDMIERQRMLEHKATYADALAQAQRQMAAISRDMVNTQTKSRYASLAQVDAAIRPIYTGLGLAITFDTRDSADRENWIRIVAEVSHGAYSREFVLPLPVDGLGAKGQPAMTKTHAMISAITYGRRALLKMIFNLAEFDDDGNRAGAKGDGLSAEQISKLAALIVSKGRTVENFCTYANIEALGDLAASRWAAAYNYVDKLEPVTEAPNHNDLP